MTEFFEELRTWLPDVALNRILPTLIILVAGMLLIRLIMTIAQKSLVKTKLEKAAHSLILSMLRVVLYILLALIAASTLGVDVTGVVALASVLTLAVSLSVQDALTNVIGGFTLLSTHPFSAGDYVEIGDQGGTVQEIGMAYTKLTTPDNKLISLPNSTVVTARIVNYSVTGTRRVEVTISASYDNPSQKVIDALVLAGTMDNVLLEPAPAAVISEYGESAIQYSLRVWVKTENYWDVYHALNLKVRRIFEEQGITMTYPHLNIHLASGSQQSQ